MSLLYTTRGYYAQRPYLKPVKIVFRDPASRIAIGHMEAYENKLTAIMQGLTRAFKSARAPISNWSIDGNCLVIRLAKEARRITQRTLEKMYTVLYTFDSYGDKHSWCKCLKDRYCTSDKQQFKEVSVIRLREITDTSAIKIITHTGELLAHITRYGQSETSA